MHRIWLGLTAGALAMMVLSGYPAAVAAQIPPPGQEPFDDGGDMVSINFDGADLREVINAVSRMTGQNFLIDPAVKGTVTIVAPRRVPRAQAFEVLQAILELHGFALVPGDNAYKVVQARTAAQKDIPVCVGRDHCPGFTEDQLVTQLIPLRYAEAQGLTGILQSLVSRDSNMVAHPNTNTIIMTDSSANIRRILRIVDQIDVSGYQENITIIALKYARADQIAQTLREALEPIGAQATPRRPRRAGQPPEAAVAGRPSEVKIIPETRTNSLIIVANEIDSQQVMFLIRELDTQTPVEQNNIHVYQLSNALAPELADVLTNLASAAPPAGDGAASAERVRTFYPEVSVVADEATNALLLIASPQDFEVMRRIIDQLDVRRPQVLVEVLIAEVSLDFARNLGIRWSLTGASGRSDGGFAGVNQTVGASTLSNLSNLGAPINLTNIAAVSTAVPGALPVGGTIGALSFDMGVLQLFIEANANQLDSDFNILSSPNLLMLDNEEARIVIADNVPFVTGTLTDTGAGSGLAQNETFEFRDVGITLEVTPHIAPDGTVRLELHQEVNEVGPEVLVGQSRTLTEVKREVTTVVLVNDRHTVVIGGLITESDRDTVNKVPVLGDIPLFGWLFKNRSRTTSKTNLMVFITPTIVPDLKTSEWVTREKARELPDQAQEQMQGVGTYRRSRTFRPQPRNSHTLLPAPRTTEAAAAVSGRIDVPGLIDAPVK